MRPASEMSRVCTSTPPLRVKAWTMGSKDQVARAGASSIWVQMMVELGLVMADSAVCRGGRLARREARWGRCN